MDCGVVMLAGGEAEPCWPAAHETALEGSAPVTGLFYMDAQLNDVFCDFSYER